MLQPLLDPAKRFWDYIVVEPSYVIFKIGNIILAKNGSTGEIEFSGTDAATVIQQAIDALTSGRTWKEKIVLKGNFEISDTIKIPSYTVVEIQGKLKLADNVNKPIIANSDQINGNTDIEIIGGELDGNKANQTIDSTYGIHIKKVENCLIEAVTLHDVKGYSIKTGGTVAEGFDSSTKITIARCIFYDNADDHIVVTSFANILGCVFKPTTTYNYLSTAVAKSVNIIGNTFFSAPRAGVAIEYGSTDIAIIGNSFYDCKIGVDIYDATYVNERVVVMGNVLLHTVSGEGECGVLCNGPNVLIASNVISGYDASPRGYGTWTGKANDIVIMNRIIGCRWAIVVGTTALDNYVAFNDIRDNPNLISDVGTNTKILHNPGYATEASGTATITGDGTTTSFTVDVTHGLVSDKLSAKVACKKPATCRWYLVDIDADGTYETLRIEITFDTAPASGETVEIYWEASVV